MISASDYSQRLSISRVKMLSESFSQSIKISECSLSRRNEVNKEIKDRLEDDYSNKDLFKLI